MEQKKQPEDLWPSAEAHEQDIQQEDAKKPLSSITVEPKSHAKHPQHGSQALKLDPEAKTATGSPASSKEDGEGGLAEKATTEPRFRDLWPPGFVPETRAPTWTALPAGHPRIQAYGKVRSILLEKLGKMSFVMTLLLRNQTPTIFMVLDDLSARRGVELVCKLSGWEVEIRHGVKVFLAQDSDEDDLKIKSGENIGYRQVVGPGQSIGTLSLTKCARSAGLILESIESGSTYLLTAAHNVAKYEEDDISKSLAERNASVGKGAIVTQPAEMDYKQRLKAAAAYLLDAENELEECKQQESWKLAAKKPTSIQQHEREVTRLQAKMKDVKDLESKLSIGSLTEFYQFRTYQSQKADKGYTFLMDYCLVELDPIEKGGRDATNVLYFGGTRHRIAEPLRAQQIQNNNFVYKVGRSTGLQEAAYNGVVIDISPLPRLGGVIQFETLINKDLDKQTLKGDSGGLIFTVREKFSYPIGITTGVGYSEGASKIDRVIFTLFTPIRDILTDLQHRYGLNLTPV